MVSTPYLFVWLEQLFRNAAEGGLPGDAVSVVVGDEEVGNHVGIEFLVGLFACNDAAHRMLAGFGIGELKEPLTQFRFQRFRFGAGIHNAL